MTREELQNAIADEIRNKVTVCMNCGGSGDLGTGRNLTGRLISCETCGGHEDALGCGLQGVWEAAESILALLTPKGA